MGAALPVLFILIAMVCLWFAMSTGHNRLGLSVLPVGVFLLLVLVLLYGCAGISESASQSIQSWSPSPIHAGIPQTVAPSKSILEGSFKSTGASAIDPDAMSGHGPRFGSLSSKAAAPHTFTSSLLMECGRNGFLKPGSELWVLKICDICEQVRKSNRFEKEDEE